MRLTIARPVSISGEECESRKGVQHLLGEIQRVTENARAHTEQRTMDKHQSQLKKDLSAKEKELERAKKRLADLGKLFRKAFQLRTDFTLSIFIFCKLHEEPILRLMRWVSSSTI